MNLSKRLAVLLSLIPEGGFLSDVGSDHAYLPAAAILDGKVEAAQAIEDEAEAMPDTEPDVGTDTAPDAEGSEHPAENAEFL